MSEQKEENQPTMSAYEEDECAGVSIRQVTLEYASGREARWGRRERDESARRRDRQTGRGEWRAAVALAGREARR